MPAAAARSRTVQFSAALAILTCALVTGILLCYCHRCYWHKDHSTEAHMSQKSTAKTAIYRRNMVGGSDAKVVMGQDEAALIRLWREKRGEIEPEDLSSNLIVQLGVATEELNRHWFERNSGQALNDVQRRIRHPVIRWMGATLDGVVEATGAVFEAKFMLPWSFSEEVAAEKYMPQLRSEERRVGKE